MKKTVKYIISAVLLIACVASITEGTFSVINAVKQNAVYQKNITIVNEYNERYESDKYYSLEQKAPGISKFKERFKDSIEKAQQNANDAKKMYNKYLIISVVLYVSAFICAIASIIILTRKRTAKE